MIQTHIRSSMLTIEEALELPSVLTVTDVGYIAKPNTVEVVLSDKLAPQALTRTAFVLPFLDGKLVMTHNRRRGIELTGGHIEDGEDAYAAAIREVLEEAACVLSDVTPIGFLRMISKGNVPPDWPYPHPIGYQQFFTAKVVNQLELMPTDEIIGRIFVEPDDKILNSTQLAFSMAAMKRLNHENY